MISTPDSSRIRRRRVGLAGVGIVTAALLSATGLPFQVRPAPSQVAVAAPPVAQTATTKRGNPLASRPLYVDPDTTAMRAVTAYPAHAESSRLLASVPQARWFGSTSSTSRIRAQVDSYVSAATRAKRMPVLVLYAIPHRDCGSYSAGGLADRAAYRDWVAQVVKGIDGRRVAVVVEPDALPLMDCLPAKERSERYAAISKAVKQLTTSKKSAVYLDIGHSRWLNAKTAAKRLKAAGVSRARGFTLNVSNFMPTAEQVAYGERVSAKTGGKSYLVDTSRNGQGPAPAAPLDWCNPAGRGIGLPPTTRTTGAHADGSLWIKHPGESDGECGRGDPPSGQWFDAYAAGLVQRAQLN